MLIFDGGYAGRDVHIYEHKETRATKELKEEIKAYLRVKELSKEFVRHWVEREFYTFNVVENNP